MLGKSSRPTEKSLLSLSPCKELNNSTLRFIESLFIPSPDFVSVDIYRQNDNPVSCLAFSALKSTEAIQTTFHKHKGVTMYTSPFRNRNVLIFLSDHDLMIAIVKNRCMTIEFYPLSDSKIEEYLKEPDPFRISADNSGTVSGKVRRLISAEPAVQEAG